MMKVWVWVTGQGSHPTSTTWKIFQFADQMPVMINNVWISFPVSLAMLFKLTPGCLLYGKQEVCQPFWNWSINQPSHNLHD